MTSPQPELVALVRAQAATRASLTAQAVAIARSQAQAFRGWYDYGRITVWAGSVAQYVEGLQRAQATSTDAYLARALSQMLGKRVRPVGAVNVAGLRRGITHAGVYGRAADVYRWQQAQFDQFARQLAHVDVEHPNLEPFDKADPVAAAVERVAAVADMDMQLADRAQSAAVLQQNPDVTGYRRVIHPEKSKGGTCGLCIAASDRVYKVGELKPLHSHCSCAVLPIVGDQDPGASLNNLDLRDLYAQAGGKTSGKALKRTRYQVNEHGELGPVLTDGTFRTEKQANRDTQSARRPKTPAERHAAVERVLHGLEPSQENARRLAATDQRWRPVSERLDRRIAALQQEVHAALSAA